MLDISKDIRSLTDFKRETPKFLEQAKRGEGMPADEFFSTLRAKHGLGKPVA